MNGRYKKWVFRAGVLLLSTCMILPASGASVGFVNGALTRSGSESTSAQVTQPASNQDDGWENMDNWDDPGGTIAISDAFTPVKVCENSRYTFWYDTTGADIYVRDKKDGHIWSNAVDDKYYSNKDANKAMMTELLQVSACDAKGGISVVQLCDAVGNASDFKLTPAYDAQGMTLAVNLLQVNVAFDVRFQLTENGLTVTVPADSIRQKNGDRLVSLTLMPYFGAARTDENGYILIPDGSGALISFSGMDQQEERVYSYPLYGETQQDMNILLKRDEQDIKNMMLPVFGIRAKESGFMAAVSSGAEDTTLNVVPYGFQSPKLGRAYYTLNYLYTESVTINGKQIEEIMPAQAMSNREVSYFLLDKDHCDYSDMAAAYRSHLEKAGVLKNRLKDGGTQVSLDFFMGVKKTGMFFDSFVKMTTYKQVREIVSDLKKSGVNSMELTLLGWNQGGFTALPSPYQAEGQLGGNRELKNLTEWLSKQSVPVYLNSNYWEAGTKSKSVNLRKDIVRDYVGNMVVDDDQKSVMLNIVRTLESREKLARQTGLYGNAAFSLSRAGQWLWANYEKGQEHTRTVTMQSCEQVLADCLKQEGRVQVYGGNQYVLPYATSLREIPDTSSGYNIVTSSVPFYQMVISGYAQYTSIAGNWTYDFNYQKLKWVEYGCTPYFVLSAENAIKLVGSDYDKLFSSEYDVWGARVKQVCTEFNRRLSKVRAGAMVRHTQLSDTLVRVTYDSGYDVYINYATEAAKVGGVTIPAMDYTVVSTANGGQTD